MKTQRLPVLVLCFAAILVSACVSSKKYKELETALADSVRQADQRYSELSVKYDETMRLRSACLAELSALKNEYRRTLSANQNMEQRIGSLAEENAFLKFQKEKKDSEVHLQEEAINQTDDTRAKIEADFKEQIASRNVMIETLDGKLRITFADKILFDSGSDRIRSLGQQTLLKFSNSVQKDPNDLIVEGHTDNVGIGGVLKERFPTNWELSAARAVAVVRFLQENGGIDPKRLAACGYGFYRPVTANDTEQGRRANRRIEIVLTSRQ